MTLPAAVPSATPAKQRADLIPDAWRTAVIVPGAMVVLMAVVQLVATFGVNVASVAGIHPRTATGLIGVVTAPYVHGSWQHLLSNAVPFLIFGFLVMVHGIKQFLAVTVVVWLVAGLGIWLTSPSDSLVIGSSGIVFGWLAYLLARGVFNRNVWQIVVGVVLFVIWGGMFWGVLPGAPGISWQGHLFGSIGGVLAAFLASRADGSRRPAPKPAAIPAAPDLSSFKLPG